MLWQKLIGSLGVVSPIQYVGGKVSGRAGSISTLSVDLTDLTGGIASAPAENDLVVVTVVTATQGRVPTTTVTGYTSRSSVNLTSALYDTFTRVSYKVMTATPDTSLTIPATGNIDDGQAYAIQVFRGIDTAQPFCELGTIGSDNFAENVSGTGSNRPDPAALTPTIPGAWILITGGGAAATGNTLAASYLTSFLTANGADTNDANVGVGYFTGWSSGSYNPAAFTGGSTSDDNSWAAISMALKPTP